LRAVVAFGRVETPQFKDDNPSPGAARARRNTKSRQKNERLKSIEERRVVGAFWVGPPRLDCVGGQPERTHPTIPALWYNDGS